MGHLYKYWAELSLLKFGKLVETGTFIVIWLSVGKSTK